MATTAPERSPLDPVFAGHQVPFAFAEQFLRAAEHPDGIRLEGVMHRVWHRPAVLTPLFRLFGWLGVLVPYQGREVATTTWIRPRHDPELGHVHVWDRTFAFPRPVCFRTTLVFDPRYRSAVDVVGRGDVLYMVWDARFHPPDRFTLETRAVALRVRGRKLWLPRWAWKLLLGTVRLSQVAESATGDTLRVDMRVHHPLFGEIFGYEGTFRTVRGGE